MTQRTLQQRHNTNIIYAIKIDTLGRDGNDNGYSQYDLARKKRLENAKNHEQKN